MLACSIGAIAASSAYAAPASGEDQYLEQVPLGGGPSDDREKAREDFAESVGGKDGVVTEADVRRAAAKNRGKADGEDPASSTASDPPPAAQSVATAARYGPLSTGALLTLFAIVAALAGIALLVSKRTKPV